MGKRENLGNPRALASPRWLWPVMWCGSVAIAAAAVALGTAWLAPAPSSAAVWSCAFTNEAQAREAKVVNAASCSSCHHFDPALTHPVNVRPSMKTPTDLPLTNGVMTCLTCHDADPEHAESGRNVGQRVRSGAAMCIECHSDESAMTKDVHAIHVGRAHLIPELPFGVRTGNGSLDSESQSCMSCHDGTLAPAADGGGGHPHVAGHAGDHPLGVVMQAGKRVKDSDFRLANPRSIDHRVRLFNGAVGCGSCHSAYSREQDQLVMSNLGSRLCLTCHTQ